MTTKREKLAVEKRTITGKKVKKLRRDGVVPGNVYGKGFKSTAVQLPTKEFLSVFEKVHETGLVDLDLNGEVHPVLIHNVHVNPKTQDVLHADFFKVNLKEKITAQIPVIAVGEPKAVADQIGLLEQPVNELEVEALPTDLPENIEVNVEHLAQIDEQITVEQIPAPAATVILNEPSQVVFKIGELITKEAEEQAAAEEAAAEEAAEAAEGETAEGEEKPEGEEPKPEDSAGEGEKAAEGEAKPEEPQS